MPGYTFDELQKLGAKPIGIADSETPKQIQQPQSMSPLTSPVKGAGITLQQLKQLGAKPIQQQEGVTFDQLQKSGAKEVQQGMVKQQPYTGQIETTSPLSLTQRAGLSTEGSLEGRKNILKQMGFETLQDKDGNLLVKSNDKIYPVDEKGFSLGDIADFTGGQLPIVGNIAGYAIGGAIGSIVPGAGTAAGAIVGGGIGAGIGNFLQQKIAQNLGSGESLKKGELAIQTGVGAAVSAIPGGKIVQEVLGKFGGNALVDKLIASGARKVIEDSTINVMDKGVAQLVASGMTKEAAQSAMESTASKYATNLISSELSKTVAGRAAINTMVSSIVGAGQGAAETAYQGGNLSDIAQGGLYGAGSGAFYGPIFGEVLHQGIGVTKLALPKASLETRLLQEFSGKTPTIEEVKSFVEKSGAKPEEKARILALTEKPIEFSDPVKFREVLNRELPKYSNTGEVRTPITEQRIVKEVTPTSVKYVKTGGEVVIPEVKPVVTEQPSVSYKLPKDLSGAKPRYKTSQLKFESDVDKALYIIAQTKKSARDSDYMDFLKTIFPTKDEMTIRKMGGKIKTAIGEIVKAKPGEEILTIPKTAEPKAKVTSSKLEPLAQEARKYKSAEEFVKNYRGGLLINQDSFRSIWYKQTSKGIIGNTISKITKNDIGVLSDILTPQGKQFVKDFGLNPDKIAFRIGTKKEYPPDSMVNAHARSLGKNNQAIEFNPDMITESGNKIELTFIHELTHVKQTVLGRIEKSSQRIREAIESEDFNNINPFKTEKSADKSAQFHLKSHLTDFYNQVTKEITIKDGAALTVKPTDTKPKMLVKEQPLQTVQEKQSIAAAKVITEQQPQEVGVINQDNTVNVNELYNKIIETNVSNMPEPKIPLLSKMIRHIESKLDPLNSPSSIVRGTRKVQASVVRIAKSFGEPLEDFIRWAKKITKYTDQFRTSTKVKRESLYKDIKAWVKEGKITQERFDQLWENALNNDVAAAKEEGRKGVFTKDEMLTQTKTPVEREFYERLFEITKDISEAEQGRSYKDANNNFVYETGKPSIFAPKISPKDITFGEFGNSALFEERVAEQTKANLEKNPNQSEEQARNNAIKSVSIQAEHAGIVATGHERTVGRETLAEMQARGVETDFNRAMDAYINKSSKRAAVMKTFKESNIPITPLAEGESGIESAINSAYNHMEANIKESVNKAIKELVAKNPGRNYKPEEELALKNVFTDYLTWLVKGVKPNDFINTMMKVQSLKLNTSGISNFFQPLLDLLKTDFPTWISAVRDRVAGQSDYWKKAYQGEGFSNREDLAAQSGTIQPQYIESIDVTTGGKILNKITDISGASLRATEGPNRLFSSDTGFKQLYKAREAINSDKTSIQTKIRAASDILRLTGKTVDIKQKVELTHEDFKDAAYNNVKDTQFGYDPLNLPYWVTGPKARALAQFRTFVYSSARLNYEASIGELRAGNFGRATRNLFIMGIIYPMVGETIRAFRHYVLGTQTPADESAIHHYFSDWAELTGGGFVDSVIEARSGAAFMASLEGPIGTTGAQSFDALSKFSLESIYKFITQQFGGAGTALRNINNPR